jgi:hypothetical protein
MHFKLLLLFCLERLLSYEIIYFNIVHWKLVFCGIADYRYKSARGISIAYYQICQNSGIAVAEAPAPSQNSGIGASGLWKK